MGAKKPIMNLHLILQGPFLHRKLDISIEDFARTLAGFARQHVEGDAPGVLERRIKWPPISAYCTIRKKARKI